MLYTTSIHRQFAIIMTSKSKEFKKITKAEMCFRWCGVSKNISYRKYCYNKGIAHHPDF